MSPITGNIDRLAVAMADPVELGLLHMITADPQRTPTFVLFGNPNYFFLTGGPGGSTAPVENPGFAWNHGGIQREIVTTFLGMVGPGVQQNTAGDASDDSEFVFSDHTDVRPTILALLGLRDDYQHDGRVLFEYVDPSALPLASTGNYRLLVQLAQIYKQINAPVGRLGKASLAVSTVALKSNSPNDQFYKYLENRIAGWKTRRDALAGQMKALLEGAAFNGQAIPQLQAEQLIAQAQALLNEVTSFAENLD